MTRVRRAIGPIAAAWLVCQAVTLTLVPAQLEASLAECVCAHGADATCPMHHRTTADSRVCAMQSLTTSAATTVNALFSVVGLVPARSQATTLAPMASPVLIESSMAAERPSPPDPPPPRA
jgi:hypothetical protein